jgi:hypothetical protein
LGVQIPTGHPSPLALSAVRAVISLLVRVAEAVWAELLNFYKKNCGKLLIRRK